MGGRPIELDVCKDELCVVRRSAPAADPAVVAVLEDTWNGGKGSESPFVGSIADSLAGRKPLHESYSDSGTSAVAYYPIFSETAVAMALEAKKLTAPGDRVLVIEGAGKPTGISSILEGRDVLVVDGSESETLADSDTSAWA